MQEVFEKIVEILENKAHEAEKNMGLSDNYADAQAFGGKQEGYENAIEIVKQAAAEYNSGWIQVSERLPKEPEEGLTDIDECDEYIVMIEGADIPTALNYVGDGEWYRDGNYYKVIAWMPLPQPYQPNACQDTNCPYNDGNECPVADGCAGYKMKGE